MTHGGLVGGGSLDTKFLEGNGKFQLSEIPNVAKEPPNRL